MPGLGRHLFLGGTAALKGINTAIAKEYRTCTRWSVQNISTQDTECPTLDYLDRELAPRGNYQTEAAFPSRVISGHTVPMGLALASDFSGARP